MPWCSCMAVDRRDAHGVGPQPLSPNVAGKRSRSICAGMANPTGRAKATIGWSASPAISRKCCATCLGSRRWWAPPWVGLPRCCWRGLSPGIASAVVLVDIVPNMDLAGASRIHAFMAERVESGFGSLDEVADVIANYNPHRPRPSDPDGLVANLRRRGDRWYWHWDPQFIGGIAAFPPVEVTDVDRMNAAVATILRDEVPVLRARPSQRHRPPRKRRPISLAVSASRVHRCARRRTYGRRRSQRRFRRGGPRFSRSACRRPMMGLGKVLHSQPASACVRTPTSALACRPYVSLIWVPSRRAAARR